MKARFYRSKDELEIASEWPIEVVKFWKKIAAAEWVWMHKTGANMCWQEAGLNKNGHDWVCTRAKGHKGAHVASRVKEGHILIDLVHKKEYEKLSDPDRYELLAVWGNMPQHQLTLDL